MKKFLSSRDPVVPMHHPRVLVETAVLHGASREALLEASGLTDEMLAATGARISYDHFEFLERAALELSATPSLGIHFGRNIHFSQFGLLGLALMSSTTGVDALGVGLRYYRLFAPGWDLALRTEGNVSFLSARETIPRGDLRAFATEALLGALNNLSIEVLGQNVGVRVCKLGYPAPAYAAMYSELFGFVFEFDAEVTEVEFDTSTLGERITTADPATATMATHHIAKEAAHAIPPAGLLEQVRHAVRAAGTTRPSLEDVAKILQTSTRSLRRALQEQGTTYLHILNDVLLSRAQEQVRAGTVKMDEVALELGFSDARSFRRAFKRWTGQTPGMLRSRK